MFITQVSYEHSVFICFFVFEQTFWSVHFLFQLVFTHLKCVTHYDTFSRVVKMSFVGSARFNIAIFYMLCYTIVATQLNIAVHRESVFIFFGKNAFSILAFSCGLLKVVSQQSELCVFRCVASAAHFFIFMISNGGKDGKV